MRGTMAPLDSEAHLDHRYPNPVRELPDLLFTVDALPHFFLCFVFQGPPGIAGLPVSTAESVWLRVV